MSASKPHFSKTRIDFGSPIWGRPAAPAAQVDRDASPGAPGEAGGPEALTEAQRQDLSRAILADSKAVVYVKDRLGRYVFVNRQFETVLRVRAADVLGKTDYEVHPRETAELVRANDVRVMRGGAAEEIEEIIPIPGSDRPHTYVSVKEPLFDADGRPYALCGISTDITERKRVEETLRMGELRYRLLVEATAAIVWSTPAHGEMASEQPGWSGFTGQTFEALRGWGWLDAVHPDDRGRTALAWSRAVESRGVYEVEHRIRRRDGEYRDMCVRAVPVPGPDGSVREWMGVHIDVTDRKAAEAALHESRMRHAAAMAASGTGTYRWELQSDEVEWDQQMRDHFELPPHVRPSLEEAMSRIHPDDRSELTRYLDECRRAGGGRPTEFRVVLADGGVRWLRAQGLTFSDASGRPAYIIGGCVDVTGLKLAEERLHHRANHDALTGLFNRDMIQSAMDSCVGEGPPFAFLLLDLDRFKEINDTFGHDHGDAVLQELNPRLRECVPQPCVIARLGGDEFGVLLKGAGRAEAEEAARAIQHCMRRPVFVDGQALEVGASVGIALFPDHGRDVASLLRVADVAMYAAKRARSGWAVYQPAQDCGSPRRLNMVGELRQAIEEDQLVLHYQPKLDLRTMQEVGAEALVRWRHPREGLVAPGVFVPLAEETGLIRPLSLWVLDQALRDFREHADAGGDAGIAVNLAPESLQDPRLASVVVDLLGRYQAPPGRLTIEVTATAMMRNPARAERVLHELHEMGVRISIDDFGTGYSSLAYLKELPVDEVKVDRSFVKDAKSNRRDACIVRSVIDLGHNLGLRVVAEGVEDEETLTLLRIWGCDLAQGFHLSRPLAPESWMRRLGGRSRLAARV